MKMLDYEVFELDYEDAQTLVEFASPDDFIGWDVDEGGFDFYEGCYTWDC